MSYIKVSGEKEPRKVGKIVCVGANYAGHNKEMGREGKAESILFFKPSTSILQGDTFHIPSFTTEVHHEVEMVLLIGKGGSNIHRTSARQHIEAIGVGLDMTARDIQLVAKKHGFPWAMSKGFDNSAILSEFVPLEDDHDLNNMVLKLTVNGETRQGGSTALMLHDPETLLAFASRFFTFEAGDLLFTGTPEGVSAVADGDILEFALEGIVESRVSVRDEHADQQC